MEVTYPWLIISFLTFVAGLLIPSNEVLKVLTKWLHEKFGIKFEEDDVTEEEIMSMVNEGHEQGVIEANEAEMISNIFELGDKEAQDVMQHRVNVISVDGKSTLQQALEFMLGENKSRYPVFNENSEDIIGIIHLRDAFTLHTNRELREIPIKDLEGLVRDTMFVPETKNTHELFRSMQAEKMQMVIVVDEYGQMSGIVTLEDILEEIVGNILDEYDVEEEAVRKLSDESFIMEGMTRLDEIEDVLGISIEEEFDTLNGLLISKLEHIPKDDEMTVIEYQGYEFTILSIDNKKIAKVKVRKKEEITLQTE